MIKIIAVGKIKEPYLVDLVNDYVARANKFYKLQVIEIPDDMIQTEGKRILGLIQKRGYNIALDIKGKLVDSPQFSELIAETLMHKADINFIIGGSNGLSKEVLEMVDESISFSALTFPHGLFRGLLAEQIYRAGTIKNNHPYHKWWLFFYCVKLYKNIN